MSDGGDILTILAALLAGTALICHVLLRGWEDWLRLRRLELGRDGPRPRPSAAGQRLELIDLKDRVKRLEAIAEGSDGRAGNR